MVGRTPAVVGERQKFLPLFLSLPGSTIIIIFRRRRRWEGGGRRWEGRHTERRRRRILFLVDVAAGHQKVVCRCRKTKVHPSHAIGCKSECKTTRPANWHFNRLVMAAASSNVSIERGQPIDFSESSNLPPSGGRSFKKMPATRVQVDSSSCNNLESIVEPR